MTIKEASERYKIPIKVLQEYESWGLCGEVKKVMGSWHYDESDIERLSTIMTLHDIGFTNEQVEKYMRLLLKGKSTEKERLKMLNEKRNGTLDEIHFKEKQLDRLDYLRFEIQKGNLDIQNLNKGVFTMKKIFSILMVFTLLFSLAACSNSTTNESSSYPTQQSGDQSSALVEESNNQGDAAESSEPNDSSTPAETGSKSLVVYFSWSGNTENVAKSIQSQTDSDIFEIVPATPYSDDYDTVLDLAQEEQRNNARPEISEDIENMEQYDVVYVGYPNWWGDMPMILYTFFDTYDLSGKTVALFCTSGGSGLSGTVNEVKSLEPNATVTQGLHIGSGSSSNPDNAVSEWLNEIGLAK